MHIDSGILVAQWPSINEVGQNWGDKLNPILINKLSELPVVHSRHVMGWGNRPVYRVIGSGLAVSKSNHVVWGMGFMDSDAVAESKPAVVYAVRGPLTREKLLEQGIYCPDVYGDPAILCPIFYYPNFEKKYDIGLIQHFREKDVIAPVRFNEGLDVLHIDICSSIYGFIDSILSCRAIVSSSLHGIICAHAYGIPAYWLKASGLLLGDDFKFHDYYASIGHPKITPARIDKNGVFVSEDLPKAANNTVLDAKKLLENCPFLSQERKSVLHRKARKLKNDGYKGLLFGSY